MQSGLLFTTHFKKLTSGRLSASDVIVFLLVLAPVLSLAVNALTWFSYGIDLPYADDWRSYRDGTAYSLNPYKLFVPTNDTLFPVGRALDALAARYLAGNSVAYQFISMVLVLGSLLFLQWRLLVRVLDNRVQAAVSFAFTVLMLQPDSYWGLQNIAYHQALPLICVFGVLLIVTGPWRNSFIAAPSLLALGFISGMTYVSGAFAIIAVGFVLLLFASFLPSERRSYRINGSALMIAGAACTAAQVWVIVSVQHGKISARVPWALPNEMDFWAYMMGKFGRALLLPANSPRIALVITAAIVFLVAGIAVVFCYRLLRAGFRSSQESRAALVFLSLLAVVCIYLVLVTAGRAKLRPNTVESFSDVFAYGFLRFHFFWATILWPWLCATLFLWSGQCGKRPSRYSLAAAFLLPVIFLPVAGWLGAFNHGANYRERLAFRVNNEMNCIVRALQNGGPIICPRTGWDQDLSSAFQFAQQHGASFTRYFASLRPDLGPVLQPLTEGPTVVDPLPVGEIVAGRSIVQTVNLQEHERRALSVGGVVCLRVFLATYARENKGRAKVSLGIAGEIREFELPFASVEDNKFYEFCGGDLRPRSYSNNDAFIRIDGLEGEPGKAVTAWMSTDTSRGEVAIDGQNTGRSLVFTISAPRRDLLQILPLYILWLAVLGLAFLAVVRTGFSSQRTSDQARVT